MPTRLNIEILRARGLAYGYVLQSPQYLGSRIKYKWDCSVGHPTQARIDAVESDSGCFDCGNIIRKDKLKSSVEFLLSLCIKKNFQCLAPSLYLNCKQKMFFICSEGHLCLSNFNSIQRDVGCDYCFNHINIDKLRLFAISKGGKCESPTYSDIYTKMNWSCGLGHMWQANCRQVMHKKNWCSTCAKSKTGFENSIFKAVLGEFPNALQNVKGLLKNKQFELDIYIPGIGAIECDGDNWHNRPVNIERDSRKNKECSEAGIKLLRVRYSDTKYGKDYTKVIAKALDFLRTI